MGYMKKYSLLFLLLINLYYKKALNTMQFKVISKLDKQTLTKLLQSFYKKKKLC